MRPTVLVRVVLVALLLGLAAAAAPVAATSLSSTLANTKPPPSPPPPAASKINVSSLDKSWMLTVSVAFIAAGFVREIGCARRAHSTRTRPSYFPAKSPAAQRTFPLVAATDLWCIHRFPRWRGGLQVQGVAGFGSGMTAMAITPLVLPMLDAVAIVGVFVLIVDVVLAVQLRAALGNPAIRAMLPWLMAGSVVGVPFGVSLLTHTDPRLLQILLGLCMLAFVGERIMHECLRRAPAAASPGGAEDRAVAAAASAGYSPVGGGPGAGAPNTTAAAEGNYEQRLLPSGTVLSDAALMPNNIADRVGLSLLRPPQYGTSGAVGGGASAPTKAVHAAPARWWSYWGDPVDATQRACVAHSAEVKMAALSVCVGLSSGLLNGALNEGGPPVIIFITLQGWPKDDAKAMLNCAPRARALVCTSAASLRPPPSPPLTLRRAPRIPSRRASPRPPSARAVHQRRASATSAPCHIVPHHAWPHLHTWSHLTITSPHLTTTSPTCRACRAVLAAWRRRHSPRRRAVATLRRWAVIFTFMQILTVLQLATQGVLHRGHLYYDVVGLPAVAIGLGLGVVVYNRLDQVLFTRIVVCAMLVMGTMYISAAAANLHEHPL